MVILDGVEIQYLYRYSQSAKTSKLLEYNGKWSVVRLDHHLVPLPLARMKFDRIEAFPRSASLLLQ